MSNPATVWITPGSLDRPVRNDYATTADFMLADGIWTSLQNPDQNFLSAAPDAEYASPEAYKAAVTAYAETLLQNRFPVPYAPVGWDPKAAAQAAIVAGFADLAKIPVSIGDPFTVSVFVAWVAGTGQLPGGHPAVAKPATQSTGLNPATGPNSAPESPLLGGVVA